MASGEDLGYDLLIAGDLGEFMKQEGNRLAYPLKDHRQLILASGRSELAQKRAVMNLTRAPIDQRMSTFVDFDFQGLGFDFQGLELGGWFG
jgi:hypothetical protein